MFNYSQQLFFRRITNSYSTLQKHCIQRIIGKTMDIQMMKGYSIDIKLQSKLVKYVVYIIFFYTRNKWRRSASFAGQV